MKRNQDQVAYTWERHDDKDIRKFVGYDLRIRTVRGTDVGEPQIVRQSDETVYISTLPASSVAK